LFERNKGTRFIFFLLWKEIKSASEVKEPKKTKLYNNYKNITLAKVLKKICNHFLCYLALFSELKVMSFFAHEIFKYFSRKAMKTLFLSLYQFDFSLGENN
jgi:hypothetical protein